MAFIEPNAPAAAPPDDHTNHLRRRRLRGIINDTIVAAPTSGGIFFAIAEPSSSDSVDTSGVDLTFGSHQLTGGAATLFFLGALCLWIAYNWLLVAKVGATLGMLLTGTRVVDEQGARPSGSAALTRSLLWVVDDAPWFIPGLVGFVFAVASPKRQRVGDRVAKTFVVKR
jgi:uncharacterized RDD family membrane protein YckC